MTYPHTPGFRSADKGGASEEAARKIMSASAILKAKISKIFEAGYVGTADSLIPRFPGVDRNTIRSRCSELTTDKKLMKTGARACGCNVLRWNGATLTEQMQGKLGF